MKIKKSYLFWVFLFAIPLFLLPRCAQIGSLTGGDKDTIPPAVISSNPEFYEVNFSDREIIFLFDEFFVLDNMRSEFYSSPPLNAYPEFKIKGKKLVVKFDEELKDSVSYFLHFGSGIKDFTEGNHLRNFAFVFATGNDIDSLQISGTLLASEDLKPEIGAPVMLYRELSDSVPALKRPYYYTLTDSSGNFSFRYIKAGKYKLFSLRDDDANMLFNLPKERIAFCDSFLIPKIRVNQTVDTLKAGSITAQGDTLTEDSLMITKTTDYSPDSLLIFAFNEDYKKQYVNDFKRPLPGKLDLVYNLPANDVSLWFPFSNVKRSDSLLQVSDSMLRQTIWLKDSILRSSDSIFLHVRYPKIDSLGEEYTHTDSLLFVNPKNVEDSAIFTHFDFKAEKEIGVFDNYSLQFEAPVQSVDTGKIRLVQLIDTFVEDARKQKLVKFLRPEANTLIFKFERPVDSFSLYTEKRTIDGVLFRNAKSDSVWYELSPETAAIDTLFFTLNYDNNYFFSQKEEFSQDLILPYTEQSVVKSERTAPDRFYVEFLKSADKNFTLTDINSETEIKFSIDSIKNRSRLYYLKINDNEVVETDTLIMSLSISDGPYPNGEMKQKTQILRAIYTPKKQFIRKVERVSRQGFYLLFNRPVNPEETEVFDYRKEPLSPIVQVKDSLYFDDIRWKAFDTLDISVIYKDEYNNEASDSFNLYVETKKKTIRVRSDKNEPQTKGLQKVTIEKETTFTVLPDSSNYLKLYLKANLLPDFSYRMDIDSAAFRDIFGRVCLEKKLNFDVKPEEFYGTFELKIRNIGNIAQANFYEISDNDTISRPGLEKGQLLLYLYSEDDELIRDLKLTKDSILTFQRLLPQKYYVKAVYDENLDNERNTGKYFQKKQPEKVLYLPADIPIKSGWEVKYDWNIIFTRKHY